MAIPAISVARPWAEGEQADADVLDGRKRLSIIGQRDHGDQDIYDAPHHHELGLNAAGEGRLSSTSMR